MRKILLGGVTLTLLGAVSAMAADVTVQAPPPPGPTPYDWSGCYVGGNGGYGLGTDITAVNPSNGAAVTTYSPAFTAAAATGSFSYNATGGLAGGQVGCNYQPGRFWVIGAETDYDWAHISGSQTVATDVGTVSIPPFGTPTFVPWNNFASQSLGSVGTARVRLGLTMAGAGMNGYADRFLVYATAGLAYGKSTFDYSAAFASSTQTISASEFRDGWTVGVGMEWAIWGNWIARGEYLHVDFGSQSFYSVGTGRAVDVASVLIASYNNRFDIVRFGLSYKFW
jgi:outer membrane immunogenic protein